MATLLERYNDFGAITDLGADTIIPMTKGADSTVPPPVSGVGRLDAILAYMSANFQVSVATVNGLQAALDAKANSAHTHDISQIVGTVAFTQAEKDKLAGLEDAKWLGAFTTLAALTTAHPTASAGQNAHVDAGVGENVQVYIWDASDNQFVLQTGAATAETPASIKSKYESNADTNAFTDVQMSKLGGIAAGAEANPATASTAEAEAGTETALRSFSPALIKSAIDANADDVTQALLHEYAAYDGALRLLALDPTNPNPEQRFGFTRVDTIGIQPPNEVTAADYNLAADDRTVIHNNAAAKTVTIQKDVYPIGKEIRVWTTGGGAAQIRSAADVFVNGANNISADFTGQDTFVDLIHRGSNQWSLTGSFTNLVAGGGAVDPLVLWLKSGGTNGGQDIVDSSSYAHPLTWGANVAVDTSQTLYGSSAIRFPGGETPADYISIAHNAAFDIGLQDFCLRMRMRADAAHTDATSDIIFGTENWNANAKLSVYQASSEIRTDVALGAPSSTQIALRHFSGYTFANATDLEYAVERVNGVFHIYTDGTLHTSVADHAASPLESPVAPFLLGRFLTGRIYELQLIVGPPTPVYGGASYTPTVAEWTDPYV